MPWCQTVNVCVAWVGGLRCSFKVVLSFLLSDGSLPSPPVLLPQVEAVQRAAEFAPVPSRPVLTQEGFLSLCRMPPLQVRSYASAILCFPV